MRKISSLINIRQPRRPRGCDARITISDSIVLIEYTNGPDYAICKTHPKAITLLNTIKL